MASLSEMLDYANELDARRGQNVRGLAKLIDAGVSGYTEGQRLAAERQKAQNDAILKLAEYQKNAADARKSNAEADILGQAADTVRGLTLNGLDTKSQQPTDATTAGKMATNLQDQGSKKPAMKLAGVTVGGVTLKPNEEPDTLTPEQFQAVASGNPQAMTQAFPNGVTPKNMALFNTAASEKHKEAKDAQTIALQTENQTMKAAAAAQKAQQEAAQRAMARSTALNRIDEMLSHINDAKKHVGYLSAGAMGATAGLPMSPANTLLNYLAPIKSGITLGALQELKEASKNGTSGLASLSDSEGNMLLNSQGSLDIHQKPELLNQNLDNIASHFQKLRSAITAVDIGEKTPPPPSGNGNGALTAPGTPQVDPVAAKRAALRQKLGLSGGM